MKKLIFISAVAILISTCFSVNAFAEFYVISAPKEVQVMPDNYAPVEKTGETVCWNSAGGTVSCSGTGQDGEYQKGVEWPNPRFTINGDGTVTDKLTGLIWLKHANCIYVNYTGYDSDGLVTWQQALDFIAGINDGTYPDCGAGHTDWRLPNLFELGSLRDMGYDTPAICNTAGTGKWSENDPFDSVKTTLSYWSSTTSKVYTNAAWAVFMYDGDEDPKQKNLTGWVWPVRGGN